MLQMVDIHKKYVTGELVQNALNGVSLNFRDNEFVAILGPSGSGKTTLLNVIGGLDRYDSGDLIINGISTKKYTDRDWDSYRNHTIGFVFQSYNLIPHQTVLANVELALTISGVSGSERRERATKALEAVGLGDQIHKKPNQMSGGQMQRVAIARALVNDPDILLADEPTGALDSQTSVQVMDLLKEVSRDRLVVMVTHNPDLAERYANRIVRVRDGSIIDDSNPYTPQEEEAKEPQHVSMGKTSMSFRTALSLSFRNLQTKKVRTLLTAFAGSIGIIGIALILSLSTGFQNYVDQIQKDTLSGYPLTIQSETANMAMAMQSFGESMARPERPEDGTVREQMILSQMFATMGSNDLRAFKEYLEENEETVQSMVDSVQYSYRIQPYVFSDDTAKDPHQVNPGTLFDGIVPADMAMYMNTNIFQEMPGDQELLDNQYEVVDGRWPQNDHEVVVVLNHAGEITDYMAYTMGLRDPAEAEDILHNVLSGEEVEDETEPIEWTYDDLMGLTFRLVAPADRYRYNDEYGVWEDYSGDTEYMKGLVKNGEKLTVVGIICPKDDAGAMTLMQGIGYTPELTKHIISQAEGFDIVRQQLEDESVDVFTGREFGDDDKKKLDFQDMIEVDNDMLQSAFGVNLSEERVARLMQQHLEDAAASLTTDTKSAETSFRQSVEDLSKGMLLGFIHENADADGKALLSLAQADTMVGEFLAKEETLARIGAFSAPWQISAEALVPVYRSTLAALVTGYVGEYGATSAIPMTASITQAEAEAYIEEFMAGNTVSAAVNAVGSQLVKPLLLRQLASSMTEYGTALVQELAGSLHVDADKIRGAFHFTMSEEELMRLMNAVSTGQNKKTAAGNLRTLGYAKLDTPSSIAVYFSDFAAKEEFTDFLEAYNHKMEDEEKFDQVIRYTDFTAMMMSSVRTIIDSVSYVLIAFVSVSLVVSSIMIGIITYISVMERTKEIGILRAIGASKRNVAQVFNAETFIIGLCSGLLGIGLTLLLNLPINYIIRSLTGHAKIAAQLPVAGAIILVVLSVLLTLLGGLIPAGKAAHKDPVLALRSE